MRSRRARVAILLTFLAALGAAALAQAEIAQKGTLRVKVEGDLSPRKLSREGKTPIAVSVDWAIETTDGSTPPKLKTLRIEINRHGRLDYLGLPTCPHAKIHPASTARALSNCRSALVGRGRFSAIIGLEGQESYAVQGRMVIFNGKESGKPVLLAQIYSAYPFANSFVIVFAIDRLESGTYGTALGARLPRALLEWGSLTEIEMRLSRHFGYRGERHSFLSAGCPAPKGFTKAVFPLARTSFEFLGGQRQSLTMARTCQARGR